VVWRGIDDLAAGAANRQSVPHWQRVIGREGKFVGVQCKGKEDGYGTTLTDCDSADL